MAFFSGTAGNDTADATGAGTLIGFTPNDLAALTDNIGDDFTGGGGVDTIISGSGDDNITLAFGNIGLPVNVGTFDGGAGIDTLVQRVMSLQFDTISNIEILLGENITAFAAQLEAVTTIKHYFGNNQHINIFLANPGGVTLNLNDELAGGPTATIHGTNGNDNLTGNLAAGGTLEGEGGNDTLNGGPSTDILRGGSGTDTVSYASANSAVTVSLALSGGEQQFTGGGGIDTLIDIENLIGSSFKDVLTGDAGANVLNGGARNDNLNGGAGNDTLNGGAGIDTANYSTASAGVSLNLGFAAAQNTGGSGNDAPISIENVIGSAFNDTLAGTDAVNVFTGLGGNDTLVGRGGNDTLNGGAGTDIAHYAGSTAGVTVNLAAGVATGGWGTDTLISIETVIGTAFNDVLTGDSGANLLAGLGGNDVLDGGGGNDNLSGAHGADILIGGLGKDGLLGGNDADRFDFNSLSETLPATRDVIIDFSRAQGDKIDLSTIDADIDGTAGNQAFSFIGTTAFTGIDGQLRQTNNVIQGDVNGDQVADFEIVWNFAGVNLIGSDFIL